MAKKKSKKQTFKYGNILIYASCLLGLIATCMIFLPAINGEMKPLFGDVVKESFAGWQVSFGYTEKSSIGGGSLSLQALTKTLNANVLSIIAFLLPVLLAVTAFLLKNVKFVDVIVGALFIGCAVCLFTLASGFDKNIVENVAMYYKDFVWTLGVGPILAGIFSSLAGVLLIAKFLLKYFIKK